MGHGCTTGETCPRLFETERGTVVIQGYLIGGPVPGHAEAPSGEGQVEMPRETLLELVAQLQARAAPRAGAMLGAFRHSAFRLEARAQYLVDLEAERFQAFREGRPLPPWPAESLAWFERISATVASGQRWGRVHVVDQPLSDYTRFELECYRDNVRAGEDVRIAERGWRPELAKLDEDFWLLDGDEDAAYAVLMQYDEEGHWVGAWRTADPEVVERCRRERDHAIAASLPLEEYLTRIGSREVAS